MKGYQIFDDDWACLGAGYKVGKTYEMKERPICGERGFGFYEKLKDSLSRYDFEWKNHVLEIEALGEIDKKGNKSCTNKIKIVRELSWEEVFVILITGEGERCEDFHEKDLKISSAVYDAGDYKGMPSQIRLENKERTKLAIYKIADVTER